MTRKPAAWLLSMVAGLAVLAPAANAKTKPKPQGALNPAVQLQALSCASTGDCSAVGSYDDALGDSQGLLVTEVGARWQQAVEAQAPADASLEPFRVSAGGGLSDLSCAAPGDCSAVGRYADLRRTNHGIMFGESDGHWGKGVVLRLPANAITPPKPKSGTVSLLDLAGVSCGSVGNCVAVGNYQTDNEVWQAMLVVERSGHWSRAIEAPLPSGAPIAGQNAVLSSISCSRAGSCTAAGEYVDPSGHQQTLLVSGSGHSWVAAPTPSAPSDANSDPNITPSEIACATSGQCATVGTYINPLQNSLGLLLDESSGQWGGSIGAALPADAAPAGTVGDQTVVLSSVACPQVGACTAVGWYFNNDENAEGLLVQEAAGRWQTGVAVTLPDNAVGGLEKQSAGLDWISCASLGNCLATGVYTDIGYNSQGLLLSEVNGIWQTGLESPLPRNAGQVQYAAAEQSNCTAVGDCTVIGQYNDRGGDVLGYMLNEHNGSFGRATELRLPPVSGSEARLSLLTILIPGKHSARLAQIRASRHFDYEYQAVEPGTAASAWFATRAGKRVLIAIGTAHASQPGGLPLRLQLTAAGRRLLASAKQVQVSVVAEFKPDGHHQPVSAGTSFTLS